MKSKVTAGNEHIVTNRLNFIGQTALVSIVSKIKYKWIRLNIYTTDKMSRYSKISCLTNMIQ